MPVRRFRVRRSSGVIVGLRDHMHGINRAAHSQGVAIAVFVLYPLSVLQRKASLTVTELFELYIFECTGLKLSVFLNNIPKPVFAIDLIKDFINFIF